MDRISVIAQTLEHIVGAAGVCHWDDLDTQLQTQLSQAVISGTSIDSIVYPHTLDELAEVITCAHRNQWRVLPCGTGSKLHWGGLADGIQLAVSTARLNRLVDHAVGDLTITAEAGARLADLQPLLANAGQFLAIDPTYAATATLGGIVATADTGGLRHRYGGIRDMLIGISVVRTDGKRTKAGGLVVKNVAGYDLMKLMTGSYGTLGIISQVTFRIYPLPAASRTVILTGEAGAIAQAAASLLASALSPTAVELVAPQTAADLGLKAEMGAICRFQSIAVSVEEQAAHLLRLGQALGLNGQSLSDTDEQSLWQRLQEQIDVPPSSPSITCKIGVLPSTAVTMLADIRLESSFVMGCIHAGSGLGMLRFREELPPQTLLAIRDRCQAQGGFLSILAAPSELKQKLDVWGYPGNAIDLMQQIKHQFDPSHLFSPQRFVGGL